MWADGIFGGLGLQPLLAAKEEDRDLLEQARTGRVDDLTVYFAKAFFSRRKKYAELDLRLQRDVKEFFGGLQRAVDAGRQLLFSLPNAQTIDQACKQASESGLGWYVESDYLQLHSSLIERLPAALRAYVECGSLLYGEIGFADLVKIHVRSKKLSFFRFGDFDGETLPKMIQRVKVNLQSQELDVFDYGGAFPEPYLYNKSRYINEEFPNFAEQLRLEQALRSIGLADFAGHGPAARDFDQAISAKRYRIDGLSLRRADTIPSLDEACGNVLTYRDLVECGETFAMSRLTSSPEQAETYNALHDLAVYVLEPVIDYFGMIRLTYGFSPPSLSRQIKARIAPGIDQHAACERKRNGTLVCDRGGAACDFLIEDEDMEAVALWIAANTPFDRLYYYGKERPVHVSFGPQHSRQVFEMRRGPSGRLVPRARQDMTRQCAEGER